MIPVEFPNDLGSKNGSMRPEQKHPGYVLGEQGVVVIQKLFSSARSVGEVVRKVESFIGSFFPLLPGADASPQGDRYRVEIKGSYVSPDGLSRGYFEETFEETFDSFGSGEIEVSDEYSSDRPPNPPTAQQGPLAPTEYVPGTRLPPSQSRTDLAPKQYGRSRE